MERAYTEGYVQSIGFSNADSTFLHALVGKDGGGDAITVLPHVVQNFMSIDQLDTDVRIWCESHHVFYQGNCLFVVLCAETKVICVRWFAIWHLGYASVRNMKYLATHYKTPLEVLAKKKKTTPHVLLLRLASSFLCLMNFLTTINIGICCRWENKQIDTVGAALSVCFSLFCLFSVH